MISVPSLPNPRLPYCEVVRRLRSLRGGRLEQIAVASGYPLFIWQTRPGRPGHRVFISAGIHGNEPAGVECVFQLLDRMPRWMRPFNLTIFPCLNPWGYEHNRRENEAGFDLNRQWRQACCVEIDAAKRILRGRHFDLSLHLHEDYDAGGFYLYEISRDGGRFGRTILDAVSRILPVEQRTRIEGRRAQRGLVTRHPDHIRRRKRWPEALYHANHHSARSLTAETPTHQPIERRVRAHTETLRVALQMLRSG